MRRNASNHVGVFLCCLFNDFNEHIFSVNGINVSGDVIIELVNITSKQVIIDDISWTGYNQSTYTFTPTVLSVSSTGLVTADPGTYTFIETSPDGWKQMENEEQVPEGWKSQVTAETCKGGPSHHIGVGAPLQQTNTRACVLFDKALPDGWKVENEEKPESSSRQDDNITRLEIRWNSGERL